MKDILDKLEARRARAREGGGKARVEAQHKRGKLTARERVALLLDKDTFEEFDMFVEHRTSEFGMGDTKIPGDGVVTGAGTVNGRTCFVFAKDFTVFGGSLSETHAQKITKIQDLAMKARAPIIGLFDAGGARIQEGVAALGGYGEVFKRNVIASGVIPQISVIMGPCAGGDVYSPAMTDFTFMVRDSSYMFVTGPDVVKTVTNEVVTAEQLGGASVHTATSGVADAAYENDLECLLQMRRLIDFLPANNEAGVPEWPSHDELERDEKSLDTLVPDNPNKPYDIKELILKVVDEGDFFELQEAFAKNIVTGFGRIAGRSVGVVANQPMVLAGDVNYAWPTAQIAVMGAKGAVEIIFRADTGDAKKIAARTKEYEDRFLSPFVAAERGYIDDVIMPRATRPRIAKALAMLRGKRVEMPARKHDNLPL